MAIVIVCGAGIPARVYHRLACYLAERGAAVLTFDYRGIGASRGGSLRRMTSGMDDWAARDIARGVGYRQSRPILTYRCPRWPIASAALLLGASARRRACCRGACFLGRTPAIGAITMLEWRPSSGLLFRRPTNTETFIDLRDSGQDTLRTSQSAEALPMSPYVPILVRMAGAVMLPQRRRRRRRHIAGSLSHPMHAPTRYLIVPRDPHAHRFEVRCTVEDSRSAPASAFACRPGFPEAT